MPEKDLREWINRPRMVLIHGVPNNKICPAGMDYCWECGYTGYPGEFLEKDRCPNPNCPHPKLWND